MVCAYVCVCMYVSVCDDSVSPRFTLIGTHIALSTFVRYVASLGCIPSLCAHLSDEDPDLLSLVLEGLDGILKVGMEEAINPYKCEIEDNGLLLLFFKLLLICVCE